MFLRTGLLHKSGLVVKVAGVQGGERNVDGNEQRLMVPRSLIVDGRSHSNERFPSA
jgi:hypothetical protein